MTSINALNTIFEYYYNDDLNSALKNTIKINKIIWLIYIFSKCIEIYNQNAETLFLMSNLVLLRKIFLIVLMSQLIGLQLGNYQI